MNKNLYKYLAIALSVVMLLVAASCGKENMGEEDLPGGTGYLLYGQYAYSDDDYSWQLIFAADGQVKAICYNCQSKMTAAEVNMSYASSNGFRFTIDGEITIPADKSHRGEVETYRFRNIFYSDSSLRMNLERKNDDGGWSGPNVVFNKVSKV